MFTHSIYRQDVEKKWFDFQCFKAKMEQSFIDEGRIVPNIVTEYLHTERNELLNMVARVGNRNNSDVHYRINERAALEQDVREHTTPDGYIWYQSGGRDCDMCESTDRPSRMRASLIEWQRYINRLYEWAEGPVWFWLVKEENLPECKHGSRDLALEAFEDGHSHIVSSVRFECY
jgi:hypothetical protein